MAGTHRTIVPGEARRWALEHWGLKPAATDTWKSRPSAQGSELAPVELSGTESVADIKALHAPGAPPVVVRGAARGWAATGRWSLDWLASDHGDHVVPTDDRDAGGNIVTVSLRDAVARTRAGESGYARFSPLLLERPELVNDLDLDYLLAVTGAAARAVLFQMFSGGAGTRTETHCAIGNNAFVQVHGEKLWRFVAPQHTAALSPLPFGRPYFASRSTLHDPSLDTHPNAPIHEVLLQAGDVLLVPPFWWHQVDNPTESIGVAMRWHHPMQALRQSAFMTLMTLTSRNPNVIKANRDRRRFGFVYQQTLDQARSDETPEIEMAA